jgi:parallel beta-helix repeat protein
MKLWKRVARPPRHRSGKRRQIELGFDRFEERVLLAVFTVTSTADPGTGVGPNGSLRYVINQLNLSPDPTNAINFDIGSGLQIITLGTDLPAITKQVTVDGYTEAGASPNELAIGTNAVIMVQIQMHNGGVADAGLVFNPGSEGSIVRGLSFSGADNGTFGGDAGIDLNTSDVTVEGCFIGVQADGTTAGPNREGIIVHDCIGDVIGTPNPADRNLISGNTDSGILDVTDVSPAEDLLVQGNLIGTDRTGFAAIHNDAGIEMIGVSTLGNTIGGTAAGAGNVISGNVFLGILSFSGSSNCTIQGNLIGLTADGSSTLGPAPSTLTTYGIELGVGSTNNVIGGTVSGAGNVIGGNGAGIFITVSATGNVVLGNLIGTNASGASLGNATGISISVSTTNTTNTIGGTAAGAGNVISGNFNAGVSLNAASGVAIQGNTIGLAPNGTSILGNFGDGIALDQLSSDNTIGGTIAGAGNIVSGNAIYGIDLQAGSGDTGNLIAGNIVGLDALGNVAGNNQGIFIGGTANTVGGTAAAARNLISGNGNQGLNIVGSGNWVAGNYIGTDASGMTAVGNGTGILIAAGATDNVIGVDVTLTPAPGVGASAARNVISGNTTGVEIDGSSNRVAGNYIGTDVSGTIGIGVVNGEGILIGTGATDNVIGVDVTLLPAAGVDPSAARNIISGNSFDGVEIRGTSNRIAGNYIGTDTSGTISVPNGGSGNGGIEIEGAMNVIGVDVTLPPAVGVDPSAARNIISGNSSSGVGIEGSSNRVAGNFIGTDASGTIGVGNRSGIFLFSGSTENVVGVDVTLTPAAGVDPSAARNIISGNSVQGVGIQGDSNRVAGNYIGANTDGTAAVPNGTGIEISARNITIGSTAVGASNVISGNTTVGVSLSFASGVVIEGNIIGLAANGSSMPGLGQGSDGIALDAFSSDNTIGGTVAGAGNIVSGNLGYGIDLKSGAGDTGNLIAGNLIGLDGSNNTAPNNFGGVVIDGPGNTVGGTTAAARNVISGNTVGGAGLIIGSGTLVVGNYIGPNSTGSASVSGQGVGISVTGTGNTVGGTVSAARNVISGNATVSATGMGIDISGSANLIEGNYVGTTAAGTAALSNGQFGIEIAGPNNTIGGVGAGAGNVISGNGSPATGAGIIIFATAPNNLVVGNKVGTNQSGTNAVPNATGIDIEGAQTTVGGTTSGAGNLISGNNVGIGLRSESNLIAGNYIGTDITGTLPLGNTVGLFDSNNASNNTIGGTTASAGNVISGNNFVGLSLNGDSGVVIEGNIIGLAANGSSMPGLGQGSDGIRLDGTSSGNTIGGTVAGAGNIVSGNGGYGIDLQAGAGDTGNLIVGNIVGLDGSGNAADNAYGVAIGGPGNTVGGTTAAARNVIAGNYGITVETADLFLSGSMNLIEGNYIGTNKDGTVGELNTGVFITGSNNTIGGAVPSSGNVIGGALDIAEVYIFNSSMNLVQGNHLGTNADGTAGLQGGDGVVIDGGSNNTIGGVAAGAGNTIAFNNRKGVVVVAGTANAVLSNSIYNNHGDGIQFYGGNLGGVSANTIGGTIAGAGNIVFGNGGYGIDLLAGTVDTGNLIAGNVVGLDALGSAAANSLGGVAIGGTGNTVGGTTAGARNVISGNATQGLKIVGSMNLIEGNYIGTNTDGTGAVPNNGTGVEITGSNNTIGGTAAGAGNTIAFNLGNGVVVDTGTGNALLSNSIHDNTVGGISLVNGGNNNQPAPLLTGARSALNEIKVAGSLSVKAGTSYLVQYFGNNPPSAQGRTLLGSQMVSQQPSDGTVPLSFVTAATLPAGSTITAIASVTTAPLDSLNPATGDTSAFSAAATVVVVVTNPFIVTNTTDSTTNPVIGSLRFAIEAANADVENNDTIIFRIPTTDPNYVASTGSWTIPLLAGLTIDKPESGGVQHTVFVDGLSQQSQPGSATTHPVIAIDPGPGFVGTGLTLSSGGNTVGGLVVEGFPGDGIDLNSIANTIVDNFIGTDVLGASSVGNQGAGILIIGSSNTIADNLISGNTQTGISIAGSTNLIEGNYVGTSKRGTGAVPNGTGVAIAGSNNTVGGTSAGARNVISGNAQAGVLVTSAAVTDPAVSNSILGNLIGTDVTGMQPLGNRGGGVLVTNSSGNIIGGTAAGARNIISANAVAGIQISGQLSSNNRVAGNYIGTNIDGSDRPGSPDIPIPHPTLLPIQPAGVLLIGASGNTVGGASFSDASSNLISGNLLGIQILGNASAETQSAPAIGANAILGNKIGTNATGMQALPNIEVGVYVVNSASNAISGNLISGNGIAGIELDGVGSSNNSISSDLIGGNAQGQASFRGTSSTKSFVSPSGILVYYGLQEHGVVVIGASNNQIGSTGGNQLVGNIYTAVYIVNVDSAGNRYPAPTNNKVQNNSIQTNGIYGVLLSNSPNNPVDTTGATRNLFSGNPVNIRNFISAVDSQKLLPPPSSTLLPPPSSRTGISSHHKKQVKAKHPVVSHRPRVPALFPKGSHSKLVGHKPAKTH